MKKRISLMLSALIVVFFLFASGVPAFAMGWFPIPEDPPPWEDPDPNDPPPPSAPEPLSLLLIGMGVSGAAGYYIGRRKKK